ncbi:hypothetical protein [Bradyrhizobium zhanjiangense]|uniref:hypothetical protein n=1 Tax=Bradyrhizobium zhanjiangense TaxID=1325107 RepID=UPI001008E3D6|nr:hypothetical protein [Bradyrhizobium zhanjiangense]
MKMPPSLHFTPVDLKRYFNVRRRDLDGGLGKKAGDSDWSVNLQGPQTLRGIPFLFGNEVRPDVLAQHPADSPAMIVLPPTLATYVVFVHAVVDRPRTTPPGFGPIGPTWGDLASDGNELGELVSTCSLKDSDGSEVDVPLLRRFGIQQRHISLGASPFGAVPAQDPSAHATMVRTSHSGESQI